MRSIILKSLILVTLLSAAACSMVTDLRSQTPQPAEVIENDRAAGPKTSTGACAEPVAGSHQLIFGAMGACFLYPDQYDVTLAGSSVNVTLYNRSLLNTEAPLLSLTVEPANGRSLEDVTAERLAAFGLPEGQPESTLLAGVPAFRFDQLPGQDTNRRLIAVHNDLVYDLIVARIGTEYGEVGEQAEALYTLVTSTFQFMEVDPDAPLRAGPECPESPAGTMLYTNTQEGYCLLLPDTYQVDDNIATDDGGVETIAYVESLQEPSHARLSVRVQDAEGRDLEAITSAFRAEIETALPGYDLAGSFGHMLDGVPANQFNQVPGQDLSRQVVFVHQGRFYTLIFTPEDPAAGKAYEEMQVLYELVMDSFSFLWRD